MQLQNENSTFTALPMQSDLDEMKKAEGAYLEEMGVATEMVQ